MATLKVERETYESKDKKQYYVYFVRGLIRGREVRAELMPKNKDFDGYGILDLIFDISETAQLIIREEKGETANGLPTQFTVYEVQNVDEDGIIYSYKLKPRAESDKSVLNVLLQKAKRAEEQAEKETKTENKTEKKKQEV